MRNISLLIFFLVSLLQVNSYAQDLVEYVPEDAYAVVSLKTDHIFELIDIEEFNQSPIGAKLLSAFESQGNDQYRSMEEVGIDMHTAMYYYVRQTDSIWYHTILLPLSDVQRFSTSLKGEVVKSDDGMYTLKKKSGETEVQLRWNARVAALTFGFLDDDFFDSKVVEDRYGLNQSTADNYDVYAPIEDADIAPPAVEPLVVEGGMPVVNCDTLASIDTVFVDSTVEDAYKADNYVDEGNSYFSQYEANERIKDSLSNVWITEEVNQVLGNVSRRSISSNASFVKSQKKAAIVTAWVKDLGQVYDQLYLPLLLGKPVPSPTFGFGTLQAGIYVDGSNLSMKSTLELRGEMAKAFSRIYGGKMNRKFAKYLDSDAALAFFGSAVDMQAYLEELPTMGSKLYGTIVGDYQEEFNLGAELISLLVDEEAIAKTIKGDALFVLNGIIQQEVKYTDYEYDEDYNVKEIEKTKQETIPDFLLMFSSDNEAIYKRILDYAVHKGIGSYEDQVYSLSVDDLPVALYWTYRDGIVFMGTGQEQLQKIARNQLGNGASRFHKKLLRKNLVAGFFSTQRAMKLASESELEALRSNAKIQKLFGGVGDFYFKSSHIKHNQVSGEFVANTSDEFSNALDYILWMVNNYAYAGIR